MLHWILVCSCCVMLLAFPLAYSKSSKSPRPIIITLPIRIQTTTNQNQRRSPRPTPFPDVEEEESDEEQELEQRIVPRTYYPNFFKERQQQQEYNQNSNNQPNFLNWNTANKMLTLQINDFIGFKDEESSESEETDGFEEPPFTRSRQNWGYQGDFDYEDPRKYYTSYGNSINHQKKYRAFPQEDKFMRNYNDEESEDDTYSEDPMVYYLRNKDQTDEIPFDFPMPDNKDDDFSFKGWLR